MALEFLNSINLEILNQGYGTTFCNSSRLEVIDITLGSFGLLESIKGWEVSSEPSLSDRIYILFKLAQYRYACSETQGVPIGTAFEMN